MEEWNPTSLRQTVVFPFLDDLLHPTPRVFFYFFFFFSEQRGCPSSAYRSFWASETESLDLELGGDSGSRQQQLTAVSCPSLPKKTQRPGPERQVIPSRPPIPALLSQHPEPPTPDGTRHSYNEKTVSVLYLQTKHGHASLRCACHSTYRLDSTSLMLTLFFRRHVRL